MLPPAALFGSLAYQLCPRSVKSWWWRLTAWRIFTPPQKKGQLISKRVKGPLCAKIRSPLIKTLDRSVQTVGLWTVTSRLLSVHFTVTCLVAKPLNRTEADCYNKNCYFADCYNKKPCCFWDVNDFVIMLTRYWSLSQHGQLQPDPKSQVWQLSTQL